jgi:hypothetical protein
MYNFSLGMLFAILAMAYTYVYVPDSRIIRDARMAKLQEIELMALDPEKRIERQSELNSKHIAKAKMDEALKRMHILLFI